MGIINFDRASTSGISLLSTVKKQQLRKIFRIPKNWDLYFSPNSSLSLEQIREYLGEESLNHYLFSNSHSSSEGGQQIVSINELLKRRTANATLTFSLQDNLSGEIFELEKIASFEGRKIVDCSQYAAHWLIDFEAFNHAKDLIIVSLHKASMCFGVSLIISGDVNFKEWFKAKFGVLGERTALNVLGSGGLGSNGFLRLLLRVYPRGWWQYLGYKERKLSYFFKNNFPLLKRVSLLNPQLNCSIFLLKTDEGMAHELTDFLEKGGVLTRAGLCCNMTKEFGSGHNLVRVSLVFENTQKEIGYFFELLKKFERMEFDGIGSVSKKT